ncbi:MAG: hypothetical protein N3F03_01810, partial [Ignavibacteria bacterium]|nr:hypothetical protein [Ignavibacteria bacterium]
VIEAVADGKKVAEAIIKKEKIEINFELKKNYKQEMNEKAVSVHGFVKLNDSKDMQELAERCLLCDVICNKCVEVCPNRANVAIKIEDENFKDAYQIVHIDSLCNECGNCETFCPYSGKPYKDKFTIFSELKEFDKSPSSGILFISENEIKLRLANGCIQNLKFESYDDLIDKINHLKSNNSESSKFFGVFEKLIKNYNYLIYH